MITLYDATDVIPPGFEGSAFEPVLKALAKVCGCPFDISKTDGTIYRMTSIYALMRGMPEVLSASILNQIASAMRIPSWRNLSDDEPAAMLEMAAHTLRIWIRYRGKVGGAFSVPKSVFGEGYERPDENSFIDLLLAGGAKAVGASYDSFLKKDMFIIYADRPDDMLFYVSQYPPDIFTEGFREYLESMYKKFAGIFGQSRIYIGAGVVESSTYLYAIGSRIRYGALYNSITSSYSLDGGLTWIPESRLMDMGLAPDLQFSALYDEESTFGDPWYFVENNTTYLVDSEWHYPMDAPYQHIDISSIILDGGSSIEGYEGSYTSGFGVNLTSGLTQPWIRPLGGTLPSFGAISNVSVRAYFIENELTNAEVYTNDDGRTPTDAFSIERYGKTWYFVRDGVYGRAWVFGESGLNSIGYTTSSEAPPEGMTYGLIGSGGDIVIGAMEHGTTGYPALVHGDLVDSGSIEYGIM